MRELTIGEVDLVSGGDSRCTVGIGSVTQLLIPQKDGSMGVINIISTPTTCGGTTVNVPSVTWGTMPPFPALTPPPGFEEAASVGGLFHFTGNTGTSALNSPLRLSKSEQTD